MIQWIRIPEGVTELSNNAFEILQGYPNLILPKSLTDTGGRALKFDYGRMIFVPTNSPLYGMLRHEYCGWYGFNTGHLLCLLIRAK
jgi:hypothetical protein